MSHPVLQLESVRKRFGAVEAVRGVSLTVEQGAIYGILGPNGAGKSTTLRMILGILEPDSGTISVLGGQAHESRDRIGYLPEERGLYRKMTALESIAYFAQLKGMKARDARAEARRLLDLYGLGDAARRKVEALSKGMAQKVQILATIVHKPRLLILDEPFSGLDPINQELLEDLIRAQVREGVTVLFSTHVMQHAERLCDRLIMIARGAPVFDGTLAEGRRLLPRRVRLDAAEDLRPLSQLPAVRSITRIDGAAEEWLVELADGADPQLLLAACFERGIRLKHFDLGEPSLHEIFVALVGRQEKAAA